MLLKRGHQGDIEKLEPNKYVISESCNPVEVQKREKRNNEKDKRNARIPTTRMLKTARLE